MLELGHLHLRHDLLRGCSLSGGLRRAGFALGLAGLCAGPVLAQEGASLSTSERFRLVGLTLGAGGGELDGGSGAVATVEVTLGQATPIGVTQGPSSATEVEMGFWHVPEPSRHALGLAALAALVALGPRKGVRA